MINDALTLGIVFVVGALCGAVVMLVPLVDERIVSIALARRIVALKAETLAARDLLVAVESELAESRIAFDSKAQESAEHAA